MQVSLGNHAVGVFSNFVQQTLLEKLVDNLKYKLFCVKVLEPLAHPFID
jgi:hypothetical protein